jgi:hypothetical protein
MIAVTCPAAVGQSTRSNRHGPSYDKPRRAGRPALCRPDLVRRPTPCALSRLNGKTSRPPTRPRQRLCNRPTPRRFARSLKRAANRSSIRPGVSRPT